MKLMETMQRRNSRRSSLNSLSLCNTFDYSSDFDSGAFFAITEERRQEMMIDYERDYVSKFNSGDYPEAVLDADEAFVVDLIKKEVTKSHPSPARRRRRSSLPRVISVVEENHSIQERMKEEKIQLSTNRQNGGRLDERNSKPAQVFEKRTNGKRDVSRRRERRVSKQKPQVESVPPNEVTNYNNRTRRNDSNTLSSSGSSKLSREQICQLFEEESRRGILDYDIEQQKQRRAKGLPGDITFKVKQTL